MDDNSPDLQRAIALADLFELLSLAFAFPSCELAGGLSSGAYQNDFSACLNELGCRGKFEFAQINDDAEELFVQMRREYSRLYLSPGELSVIYRYESAFVFAEKGGEGLPTLFVNPLVRDIEDQMREAGVLPQDYRQEPVDSVQNEFNFLHILYTFAAASLRAGEADDAKGWLLWAEEFRRTHINTWVPSFLARTVELSRIEAYRVVAQGAAQALAGWVVVRDLP
ncbi:MAG: molecular chaperone TorD family protein [Raoultibacter sp.]